MGTGHDREIVNSIGMKLAPIPAGEFMMGGQEPAEQLVKAFAAYHRKPEFFKDEYPRHRVRITKPFYLGKYEVTVGQFRRFVDDTGYKTEAETDGTGGWGYNPAIGKCEGRDPKYNWRNPGFAQTDDHPVVNVTWNDAVAFCRWLSREGGQDLPPAHRGRVGIRLPRGNDHALLQRRRSGRPGQGGQRERCHGAERRFPTSRNSTFRRAAIRGSRCRWAAFRPTASGCATCTATCGNGAPTGTARIITPTRRWTIRKGRTRATGGCGAAGRGTAFRSGPASAFRNWNTARQPLRQPGVSRGQGK